MQRLSRGSQFWSLVVVTLLASAAMLALSLRWRAAAPEQAAAERHQTPPAARVAVQEVRAEMQEVVETYSGMLEPWESYQLGFEIGGRVAALGEGPDGLLDEGDQVTEGQLLASLDDRTLLARNDEAAARWEQAEADLKRVRGLRDKNAGAISDSELQAFVTEVAIARAQRQMAAEALNDSVLRAPISGTISRRFVLAGESVNANQICFEIVQDDRMILKLGVPEARIPEIVGRQRKVNRNVKLQSEVAVDAEDLSFRARVRLVGKDRFGQSWPPMSGTVHHISDTANEHTGVFGVEIAIDNRQRHLRPGMIARGELITQRLNGYRVPTRSVIFRGGQAFLFVVDQLETVPAPRADGPSQLRAVARRVELPRWVEQRGEVIVPGEPEGFSWVIVGGQHRLVDGQAVVLVQSTPLPSATAKDRVSNVEQGPPPAPGAVSHGS